jgi:hypothetical protein
LDIELLLLRHWSKGVSMDSSETPADVKGPVQSLQVSIEIIANLIYLARHLETHSARQQRYLEWAAKIIEGMKSHPKLKDPDC